MLYFLVSQNKVLLFLVYLAEGGLSISAIILITENGNQLLESINRKLKRFPSNGFSSNSMQRSTSRV